MTLTQEDTQRLRRLAPRIRDVGGLRFRAIRGCITAKEIRALLILYALSRYSECYHSLESKDIDRIEISFRMLLSRKLPPLGRLICVYNTGTFPCGYRGCPRHKIR